jgi:serine/threonine protein kinase
MITLQDSPLASVTCCRDVPLIEAPVEPSTQPVLRPGTMLDGRFRVGEILNRGGMATVYRAEDLAHGGRSVVIKMPLLKVESDPACFARFQREEQFGVKFNHPFLLKFHPVAGRKSRPYFATEYLRGCTLADLRRGKQPLPEADALKIVGVICAAVEHMHEHGVIHRDLKPSNIMICHDHTLRVMDFGLAADVAAVKHRGFFARLAPIFGTPEYMAPEQVRNRANDERTDIYSLGAVLYEMLTGVVPFERDDQWESAYARTRGDPVAPRRINPAISPAAEEIVLHALQRDPAGRYQTVAAFKRELDAPEAVRVTGYSARLRAPRWSLSWQTTPVLAGVLLGLGAVASLVGLFFITLLLLKRH